MRFPKGFFLVLLSLLFLYGCSPSGTSEDAVDRVAQEFGVPRESVIGVAEELAVDPNMIETFGPGYFPFNYYKRQFESFEQEHGRPPTRSEVDQRINGYIARCNASSYRIEYIYYSECSHSNWLDREIAMVFEVVFQLPQPGEPVPDDPVFAYMQLVDLRDTSLNPPEDTYWVECIQEYLRAH